MARAHVENGADEVPHRRVAMEDAAEHREVRGDETGLDATDHCASDPGDSYDPVDDLETAGPERGWRSVADWTRTPSPSSAHRR